MQPISIAIGNAVKFNPYSACSLSYSLVCVLDLEVCQIRSQHSGTLDWSYLEEMTIGGENGEGCEQRSVIITKGRENQQIRTSVVGPGHCGILVVVRRVTRPIVDGMSRPRQPLFQFRSRPIFDGCCGNGPRQRWL